MRSFAFMLFLLTHESCEGEYPFQRTRYCFFLLWLNLLDWITCSIFHSGLPSMMSGGGSTKLAPCSWVSQYGIRSDVWKTSWIFHCGGRSN